MSEEQKAFIYKVEDIFEDIPDDPKNVNMTIPPEIMESQGWKEGDTLKFVIENGTIVITKVDNGEGWQSIELEGTIVDVLPNQTFKVELENKHQVICYTGGKMRRFRIRLVMGDRVKIEMTPYDLDKGRITFRI